MTVSQQSDNQMITSLQWERFYQLNGHECDSGFIRQPFNFGLSDTDLFLRGEFTTTRVKRCHVCNYLLTTINPAQMINNKCARKKQLFFSEFSKTQKEQLFHTYVNNTRMVNCGKIKHESIVRLSHKISPKLSFQYSMLLLFIKLGVYLSYQTILFQLSVHFIYTYLNIVLCITVIEIKIHKQRNMDPNLILNLSVKLNIDVCFNITSS